MNNEICQWDVLVFLHRHRDALLGVDNISGLLGYERRAVASALDHLESEGLVKRSRLSGGVRLYHFSPIAGPRGNAFEDLFASTGSRAGRLTLYKKLMATCQEILGPNKPPQSIDSRRNRLGRAQRAR